MARRCMLVVLGLVCCVGAAEESVVARIVSSGDGSSVRVGVHFKVPPRAHIYWRNPGDSGLPTVVTWSVPAGFKVGALAWPAPVAFDFPALSETSFGYEDEVLLFSTISAVDGKEVPAGVTVTAQVRWLSCLDDGMCTPGDAALTHTVGAEGSRKEAELFARFARQVPQAVGNGNIPVMVSVLQKAVTVNFKSPWVLAVEKDGVAANFFPETGSLWASRGAVAGSVEVVYTARKPQEGPVTGVLTVPGKNKETGVSRIFYVAVAEEKD